MPDFCLPATFSPTAPPVQSLREFIASLAGRGAGGGSVVIGDEPGTPSGIVYANDNSVYANDANVRVG